MMVLRTALALALATATLSGSSGFERPAESASTDRVQFTVRYLEEHAGVRTVLRETVVDGPPATDLEVNLTVDEFELGAVLTNELLDDDHVRVRVRLESRRRYGTSPSGLPLWEEDTQQHWFTVGFDEQIDLLPFGGAGPGGTLKIEIVPELVRNGQAGPIEITLSPGSDAISVDAYRIPHWYVAEVSVKTGSTLVASGRGRLFGGESGAIELRDPVSGSVVGRIDITPTAPSFQDPWLGTAVRFSGAWVADHSSAPSEFAIESRGVTGGGPLAYSVDASPIHHGNATLTIEIHPDASAR